MAEAPLVAAIAYDRVWTFELAMTTVFALEWPDLGFRPYRYAVVAADAQPLEAFGGMTLGGIGDLDLAATADLLIVPGWRDPDEKPGQPLVDAIRHAHARGARIASLWDGVFVLAHAGVLDGRSATTHWQLTEKLAGDFPRVKVERGILYTQDGNILTSAGCLAGIDMLLALIRADYGSAVANRFASRMIAPPHRPGSHSQDATQAVPPDEDDRIGSVIAWMDRHLADRLTVATLAERAAMSTRTFARRFRAVTGTAPLRWLTVRRVRRAQELLETTDHGIERIAELSGFRSPETLRHHFRNAAGVSPTQWRRSFKPLASTYSRP